MVYPRKQGGFEKEVVQNAKGFGPMDGLFPKLAQKTQLAQNESELWELFSGEA